MGNTISEIVLHRSIEDGLRKVRSLRYSLAIKPEGQWFSCAFMQDFLVIEALSFSNTD